ncbi:hypothetical protein E2C01_043637 [Portunus trituberculatus]|uniref:Uncharacterized protein n=1 Tax=Portunus trituberculatus TaxID=210409 RepID=A0A5B7FXV2_PORTR|nr:hypothetical protein [Portunus trituberculatus]
MPSSPTSSSSTFSSVMVAMFTALHSAILPPPVPPLSEDQAVLVLVMAVEIVKVDISLGGCALVVLVDHYYVWRWRVVIK